MEWVVTVIRPKLTEEERKKREKEIVELLYRLCKEK